MKRWNLIPTAALTLVLTAHAGADMFKPSKADQVKLGQQAATELRKEEKVLPASDARVKKLNEVGRKLMDQMNMPNEPWQYSFDVIDKDELNAFALPGGPVFFFTGILSKIETEDQLAGILAHELTHVYKEHWAYAYADQQKRSFGLAVLLGLVGANRTTAELASIGNDLLLSLPYSRRHETEADLLGIDLMARAGYNPMGMRDVFEMLSRESKGGKPPEFLSTHPSDSTRIKRIEEKVTGMKKSFAPQRPLRF